MVKFCKKRVPTITEHVSNTVSSNGFVDQFIYQMFRSSHFSFLVTFGNEVTKIQKYYAIFVYILQGKMGKMEKKLERKSRN